MCGPKRYVPCSPIAIIPEMAKYINLSLNEKMSSGSKEATPTRMSEVFVTKEY
jgi:hypothetical protein